MLNTLFVAYLPLILKYGAALVGVVLLPKVVTYLKAKAAAAQVGSLAQKEFTLVAALTQCVADGVLHVESQLRPEAETDAADGKLTPEEADRLKRAALDFAKAEAKAAFPGLLQLIDDEFLDGLLGHLVDGQAAKLAGDSRVSLAKSAEKATPVVTANPPPPAAA